MSYNVIFEDYQFTNLFIVDARLISFQDFLKGRETLILSYPKSATDPNYVVEPSFDADANFVIYQMIKWIEEYGIDFNEQFSFEDYGELTCCFDYGTEDIKSIVQNMFDKVIMPNLAYLLEWFKNGIHKTSVAAPLGDDYMELEDHYYKVLPVFITENIKRCYFDAVARS